MRTLGLNFKIVKQWQEWNGLIDYQPIDPGCTYSSIMTKMYVVLFGVEIQSFQRTVALQILWHIRYAD